MKTLVRASDILCNAQKIPEAPSEGYKENILRQVSALRKSAQDLNKTLDKILHDRSKNRPHNIDFNVIHFANAVYTGVTSTIDRAYDNYGVLYK